MRRVRADEYVSKGIAKWIGGDCIMFLADYIVRPSPASKPDMLATCAAKAVSRSIAERQRNIVIARQLAHHTDQEWADLLERFGNKCLRCGVPGAEFELTKDHVIPVSKGGTDSIGNLQPLCRYCNSWKCNEEFDFRVQTTIQSVA
jgi:hypothetical protein